MNAFDLPAILLFTGVTAALIIALGLFLFAIAVIGNLFRP